MFHYFRCFSLTSTRFSLVKRLFINLFILADNNLVRIKSFLPIFLILLNSCVESKKEAGASAQATGIKYFVSEQEIQVLNQVFESQFEEVAAEIISTNMTVIRTELKANEYIEREVFMNQGSEEANCETYKDNVIDDMLLGINCIESVEAYNSYCENNVHYILCDNYYNGLELNNGELNTDDSDKLIPDHDEIDISFTCNEETYQVTGLETDATINYQNYQSGDKIYISGNSMGYVFNNTYFPEEVSGAERERVFFDCSFNYTYTYGDIIQPNCDNVEVSCNIGGNEASCEQVLGLGAVSNVVSDCE